MSTDRLSGLALIAGSSGLIITMSLHPTGKVAAKQLESMIPMLIAVHALALACLPVMFLGAWGLSQRVAGRDYLAVTALVVYTFALLAVMNAAVVDGLVTPGLLRQIVAAGGAQSAAEGWQMMSYYNFFVNQGYAQVFVAGSSAAIVLWSVASWRAKVLGRRLEVCGCILGAVTLIVLFSGYLNLDKHGMGVVIFGQAAWFIAAGAMLWRKDDEIAAATR